jgi:hypothetical protein
MHPAIGVDILFAHARTLALTLLFPIAAAAQQRLIPIRLATSYGVVGPGAIDTAQATRAFALGVEADSLMRILPPFSATVVPRDGGRLPDAGFVVTLAVSGIITQPQVILRATDVATGQALLREAAQVSSAERLPTILDSLGRWTAKQLGGRP